MQEPRFALASAITCILILTTLGYAQDTVTQNDARFPITLSLKDSAAKPVNLKDGAPEIVFEKSPDCTAVDAGWLVEIDAIENGKVSTFTVSAGNEDKKQVLIPLSDRKGTITGKSGNWQQSVELFLAFSDASNPNGQGTLRFTLVDSKEFLSKSELSKPTKLAKWLEIPIQLKKSAGPADTPRAKPKAVETDREKIAEGKLKLAKNLLKANRSAAIKRLEEIVKDFEGTAAAKEASQLLMNK